MEKKSWIFRLLSSTSCLWHFDKTGVTRISVRYDKNAVRHIEGPRKNVRSFATFPSKFPCRKNFRRCRKQEGEGEFRKDPAAERNFPTSLVSLLFGLLFRPDGSVGRRPNCVTLARVSRRASRRKFQGAKPKRREGTEGRDTE